MSEESDEKSALVPRLRFPEFRGKGDWTAVELGAVTSITTEKVGSNACTPMSITSGVGLVSQEEKFGRVIAGDSYKNYFLLKPNDFAYNKSATKEYPEGFLTLYSGSELAAVPNSIFTCFRVKGQSPVPAYLKYLFLGNLHGQWLRKFIQVGARAHGSLSINDSDLMALPVPLPAGNSSIVEQQKIADCLSSLDDLITAETQALTALKTHKKGLMQQVFPREGETVPRLRFPEFREAGEWEGSVLGNLVEIRSGNSPSQYELGEVGTYPFVKVEDLNNCEKLQADAREYSDDSDGLVPLDSVIFPKRGAAIALNKIRLSGRELLMDTNMMALTPHGDRRADFLFYYLSQVGLSHIADNSTIPQINNKHIVPFHIQLPLPKEQQHVAACLSSLDDLVTAQSQKVAALKAHKKGLMQQLFPSVGGVAGEA